MSYDNDSRAMVALLFPNVLSALCGLVPFLSHGVCVGAIFVGVNDPTVCWLVPFLSQVGLWGLGDCCCGLYLF